MDNRKFQIQNGTYICMALDAETVCQKAEMLLWESEKEREERNARISQLLVWCKYAKPNDQLVQKEFIVSVHKRIA